jgi:hypothetical protein
MWHREMVTAQSYRPPTPETSSPTMTDTRMDFPFYPSTEDKSIHRDGKRNIYVPHSHQIPLSLFLHVLQRLSDR